MSERAWSSQATAWDSGPESPNPGHPSPEMTAELVRLFAETEGAKRRAEAAERLLAEERSVAARLVDRLREIIFNLRLHVHCLPPDLEADVKEAVLAPIRPH